MSEEARLLRASSRGDAEALAELVRRTAPDVHRYLAGMLGDPNAAGPATEEVYVRLARAADRYDPRTPPQAWILSLARRVALDQAPGQLAGPPPPPPEDPAAARSWAWRAVRCLPPEEREVLVCRDVLGWDPERIAALLQEPAEDVRARLAAARLALGGRGEVAAPGPPAATLHPGPLSEVS